jgi:PKD repeat protein
LRAAAISAGYDFSLALVRQALPPPPNGVPVVTDQAITTTEDVAVSFRLQASDPENDALTFHPSTVPTKGVLSGTFPDMTYTPGPDYFGLDQFTYYCRDTTGQSNEATVRITVTPVNDAPVASLRATPMSGTAPLNVAFDASQSVDRDGTITSYAWSFGDGTSANGTTASKTYASIGIYLVTLTVTDNSGSATSATQSISVTAPSPNSLPAPWQANDIGAVGFAGSAAWSAGTFTIKASGADIWGASDQFHFVYQPFDGDGEIIARVGAIQNTDAWAKCGVMMRESLAPGARHVMMVASAASGYACQWRSATGGSTLSSPIATGLPPQWVKLVRVGNTFTASRSTDGIAWTQVQSVTVVMPSVIMVGLPHTSHKTTRLSTALIDNVLLRTAVPINLASVVNAGADAMLTLPQNSLSLQGSISDDGLPAGSTISKTWSLQTGPGQVSFVDANALNTTASFDIAGTYVLKLSASDGALHSSDTISIVVREAPVNQRPIVDAGANQTLRLPQNTTSLSATISDDDGLPLGSVVTVQWQMQSGSAPIVFTTATQPSTGATFSQEGEYTLIVTASDGVLSSTDSVTITVLPPLPPAQWQSQDIGVVTNAGSFTDNAGMLTIKASGLDIWGTADSFHFAYQTLDGDGMIVARVSSLINTDMWAKAGVMVRESLQPDSKHAMIVVSAAAGVAFQWRTTTAGTTSGSAGASVKAPYWVKLERRGNVFTSYGSADGLTWTLVKSATIAMQSSVYVGLPVCSHRSGRVTTAIFDNISIEATQNR